MKFVFLFVIFALFSFEELKGEASLSPESLYNEMRLSHQKLYPKSFEAELKGEIVDKQISTIPKNKYTQGLNKVELLFKFTQNNKPEFVLNNVDPFYRNMFSIFEGVLETTGFYAVVGYRKSYSEFSKEFNIKEALYKNDYIEAEVYGRGKNKDYKTIYKINKDNFLIESATYYNKNKKIYEVNIKYAENGQYLIPKSIVYKSDDGQINSDISFMNVRILSR